MSSTAQSLSSVCLSINDIIVVYVTAGDASTKLMAVLREGFQIEQTRVHHRM